MFTIHDIAQPTTAQEAWSLGHKKTGTVLGGLMWLKTGHRTIHTAVDLTHLDWTRIREGSNKRIGECFRIGASVTLRQFETDEALGRFLNFANRDSCNQIVGVQFRNGATVGGSVALHPGFSDIITLLSAVDAYVSCHGAGTLSLQEFLDQPRTRDLIKHIYIPKVHRTTVYKNFRTSSGDFPLLNTCISLNEETFELTLAIGARPQLAKRITLDVRSTESLLNAESDAQLTDRLTPVIDQFTFRKNNRASAEYRRHLAFILLRDAIKQLKELR